MKIIVGLGNPGEKYLFTRHNLGFMLIDFMAGEAPFQNKFKSLALKTEIGGAPALLAKPQTFMNLSGRAVREILSFYKASMDDLLLIHDDKDLVFGQMKFQKSRGAGGHNGALNVHQELGSPDYCRLKMGIAPAQKAEWPEEMEGERSKAKAPAQKAEGQGFRPANIPDTNRFVLSPFSAAEREKLPLFLERAAGAVSLFAREGYEISANRFNSRPLG